MNEDFREKFAINRLSLVEFNYWIVSVRPKQPTIGSLVISIKRNCQEFDQITQEESSELSEVFKTVSQILKKEFVYDKINYLALMMVDNHVHFHVIPRYSKPVSFNNKEYIDAFWPGAIDINYTLEEPGLVDFICA